jgi:hypothetical protein
MRVVHIAPGPTLTFTTSAPASISARVPSGGAHVAGDDRQAIAERGAHSADHLDHAPLVAVRRVEHDRRDAEVRQPARLLGRLAGDPDGARHHQLARRIEAGREQVHAHRIVARQHADQPAVRVEHRHRLHARALHQQERLAVGRPGADRHDLRRHQPLDRGVLVLMAQVGVGGDADRALVVVDHDHQVVRALADDAVHVMQRGVAPHRQRRVVARVGAPDVPDDALDGAHLHVLGQHAEPAEPRHGLGHALAGDRVHVGRHDRVRAAPKIDRGQVDLEPGGTVEVGRYEEHVLERELELLVALGMKESHCRQDISRGVAGPSIRAVPCGPGRQRFAARPGAR